MEAKISKLKLKKLLNKYYISIELIDSNNEVRVIDNPFINDEISFRKQIFGIMSACGTFDLMKLGTDNPIFRKMVGCYKMNRLNMLENEKGESFYYSEKKNKYILDKTLKMKNATDMLIKNNLSNLTKEKGVIKTIESQSGTFLILFSREYLSSSLIAGQIYWGFGLPINIGDENNIIETKRAAKVFESFIVNLMKLCGINDLLDFGGNKDKLPIVDIELDDKNNIVSITNPDTGKGLLVGKKYEYIDRLKKQKSK